MRNPELHVALVHSPVVNKHGDTIHSAVTNLDLHDIARACKTYGLERFYVITALSDQQQLVAKIVAHWVAGRGGRVNPFRRQALETVRLVPSIAAAVTDLARVTGRVPATVATSAQPPAVTLGWAELRRRLRAGRPWLLLFGTAWGLAPPVLAAADYVLAPIGGRRRYNHLSVRAAAAIALDRLCGRDEEDPVPDDAAHALRPRGRSSPPRAESPPGACARGDAT